MSVALSLQDVSLGYGPNTILDGLSLTIPSGEMAALLGPSGGGKTSVLRLLLGLVAPGTGSVLLDGEAVSVAGRVVVPPEERGLAIVFQDLALWPHLTVRGNLAFVLASCGVPRAQHEERIREMLGRVGLAGKEERHPGDLSGGERQRVAIARALVVEPRAILLDEPLANLDAGLKRELLAVFRDLIKERSLTALHVTHDIREAAALGGSIAVLEGGRIVQKEALAELRDHPASAFIREVLEDLRPAGAPAG
jgi:ABC-type Fe3+/spermidine/putrescine transport system ATPase subunit